MIPVVAALVVFANLYFTIRCVTVAGRSNDSVDFSVGETLALPHVTIIVPARNEERNIERCVRSLLAQEHPSFNVVVVDDCSTDRTRELLRSMEPDARLRVIEGVELPPGWVGKPWALTQGAREASGEWLLFTDADTEHDPRACAVAMRTAIDRECDALSLVGKQEMDTLGERIALPTILLTIALGIGALADVNDPRKRGVAIFNGQYILIRREAYERVGGHASVKHEIAEDLELAKLLKRERYRIALLGAGDLLRTRMYRSFAEVWNGFVKNFALGVRGRYLLTAAAILYFTILSPVTPLFALWAVVNGAYLPLVIAVAALASATASAAFAMRRFGLPAGSALWFPVGQAVVLAILVTSLVRHATGGVSWRGRRY